MGVSWTYQVLFSSLYVGLSTRYRYLIMVLSSVMVESKFILVPCFVGKSIQRNLAEAFYLLPF